ncbi:MAG: hypothetical protein FWD72_06380, partial [Eggerthellaceae bacterium]|nr:hypothetical protein [Eggerthellaceae bacterium]
ASADGSPATKVSAVQKAYSGIGSANDPIEIADAQGLADFARDYNSAALSSKTGLCVQLVADIDMGGAAWTPIGTITNPFVGTFDGQGHRISRLDFNTASGSGQDKYAFGLFGTVAAGDISHLSIDGSIKAATTGGRAAYAGLLAAAIIPQDGAAVTIDDCSVSGSIEVGGGSFYAGGLVGYVSLSGKDQAVRLTDSGSSANVTAADARATNRIGGLLGAVDADAENSSLVVRGCEATGEIAASQAAATANTAYGIGGLCGAITVSNDTMSVEFRENTTSGKVSASGDMPDCEAGGMIGAVQAQGGSFTAIGCTAAPSVDASIEEGPAQASGASGENTATGQAGEPQLRQTAAGGLIGRIQADGGALGIKGCACSATVASKSVLAENACGGLVGCAELSSAATLSIEGSCATGALTAQDAQANAAGGLVGQAKLDSSSSLQVSMSHASGSSTALNGLTCSAGGLVGNAGLSAQASLGITNSSASADVSATTDAFASRRDSFSWAGGLVGCVSASSGASADVASCFSSGTAAAAGAKENHTGGIVGSVSAVQNATASIGDCYALGDLSAFGEGIYNNTGGLVGYARADAGKIGFSACYAASKVAASGDAYRNSTGGILGGGDVLEGATLSLQGVVAANAQVDAADATNNEAGRVYGTITTDGQGAFTADAAFAWSGMPVNGSAAPEGDANGKGTDYVTLLQRSFWEGAPDGADFDGSTWKAQDGFLPVLALPQAQAAAPGYLSSPAPTAAPPAPSKDYLATAIPIVVSAAIIALFVFGIARLRRQR